MATARQVATPRPRPERADGVELIGEFEQSGYRDPPYLVRRADGQTIQLTSLLYIVLEAIDGRRDLTEIAGAISGRIRKRASPHSVHFLVEKRLRPLGLIKQPDGTNPPTKKVSPLLAVRPKIVLTSERLTRFLTAPFAQLFRAPVVILVIIGFAAMTAWLFFIEGVGDSVRQVLYDPKLLLLTFALTVASAGFHEFGHAAACRYSGAQPGVMGAGLYLVWPVFFTDVTDSYRLSRAGRLRVDLGGLYFNALFALAIFGLSFALDSQAVLVLVPLQILQMLRHLLPFVRLDGYHILADITGVPDLFARIKPTLQSLIPWRRADAKVLALKRWVRVVVSVWVLTVIPVFAFSMFMLATGLPRMLATAADSLRIQWRQVTAAFDQSQWTSGLAGIISVLALTLPVAAGVYMLVRFARRTAVSSWRYTGERPMLRGLAGVGVAALIATLAILWWPASHYRPLEAGDRLTVQDLVDDARHPRTRRTSRDREPVVVPTVNLVERDRPAGGAPPASAPAAPAGSTPAASGSGSTTPSPTSVAPSSGPAPTTVAPVPRAAPTATTTPAARPTPVAPTPTAAPAPTPTAAPAPAPAPAPSPTTTAGGATEPQPAPAPEPTATAAPAPETTAPDTQPAAGTVSAPAPTSEVSTP